MLFCVVTLILSLLFPNTLISKRIDPFWAWSWDTLPVWASGQGASSPTGFPTEAINLYSKYPIMWTQGALTSNGTVNGYENWEQGTISDAKKIHAVSPNEPVFGYYGFPGCCLSQFSSSYSEYMNRTDFHLYDDNQTLCQFAKNPSVPCFNWCADGMLDFYKNIFLSEFVSSPEISGIFWDETEAYVEGPQAYWENGYYFTQNNQSKLLQCYQDAMVDIVEYLTSFKMFPIPSSNAYDHQFPAWNKAQNDVIENYGGFKFIESLECIGNGQIYNVSDENEWNHIIQTNGFGTKQWKELMNNNKNMDNIDVWWDCPDYNSTNDCCKDQILTAMNVAKNGGLLMIRSQQKDDEYSQRYYGTSSFLLMAYKWSYFAGGVGWSGTASFPWYNIYNYPIGKPLNDTVIHDEAETIFSRQFQNVFVSFNLSQGVSALYFNWNL